MIEGLVNAKYEPVISLLVQGTVGLAREIEADAMGSTLLACMMLLDAHSLYVEVTEGGRVLIQPME